MTTRELEELLREDAPQPDAEFAAQMERRLAEGFPRRRRLPSPPAVRVRLPRLPRGAVAGLASAGLALSVTVALLTGGGEDEEPAVAPAPTGLTAQEGSAEGGGADSALPEPADLQQLQAPPGSDIAPRESERQIERSAQLTLAAPADELDRAADDVVAVADRHRGFVLRSEMSTTEDGGSGQFELRVPQDRLRAALRDLTAIGEVRSRSEQGQDVTAVVSRTEERLEEARAERRSLLRRLERADSDEESRAIRRRLRLVSAEIRSLTRELRAVRERVDYAAITVTLEEGDSEAGAGSGGGAGQALDDALGTLEGVLELSIRVLAVLLPLALLAGLGWLAGRLALRRRRDAALG